MVERFNVDVEKNEDGYWEGVLLISAGGEWVRFSDYEALQKELAERTLERDEARNEKRRTREFLSDAQHRAGENIGRAIAAEARADALAKKVEGMKAALGKIAKIGADGQNPSIIALAALDAKP